MCSCTKSMHTPTSVTVEDVIFLFYKNKSPPVPYVVMDPWNETTVQHAREFDVPELNRTFPAADTVSVAERLAVILGGDVPEDPVPRPAKPYMGLGRSPHVEEPESDGEHDDNNDDANSDHRNVFDNDDNPCPSGGGRRGAHFLFVTVVLPILALRQHHIVVCVACVPCSAVYLSLSKY